MFAAYGVLRLWKNKVVKNTLSLFIIQGSNYILPLITFPYLVRTLGTSNYGLLIFMNSLIQYFIVLTDYGFNFSATRKIALIRENKVRLREYSNSIISIKTLLTGSSFVILIILLMAVPQFSKESLLYIIGFLSVVGNAMFPIWFFQGIEQMKYITYFNIGSKIVSTLLIFIFVKSNSDYELAALFQTLYYVLPGILGLWTIRKQFSIPIVPHFKINLIKRELKDGWHVFIGNISGNVYGQGAVVILGFLAGQRAVAYYGICQKITGAAVGLTQPFAQALYPFLCRQFAISRNKFLKVKKFIICFAMVAALLMGVALFMFSGLLIKVVSGTENSTLIILLKGFSDILMLQVLNVQISPIILAMNKTSEFQRMYVSVTILFILISLPLSFFWHTYGMLLSILFVELYICICGLIISRGRIKSEKQENISVN
ncbi:flippase [Sporolactobacillus sp. KGMB 08714]|uniref:flippase n=1 Tax=Sporolactobacillus sp. KGMB 08714 TaxID=3064704 RepID=UPI002FBE12B5